MSVQFEKFNLHPMTNDRLIRAITRIDRHMKVLQFFVIGRSNAQLERMAYKRLQKRLWRNSEENLSRVTMNRRLKSCTPDLNAFDFLAFTV